MLQSLLARQNLMCGFGTGLDPSQDLAHSGKTGNGARPTIFFGPKRDALSLITKQVASGIILKRKELQDFKQHAFFLSFAANDAAVTKEWRESLESSSGQIFPKFAWIDLNIFNSNLQSDADVFEQNFRVDHDELSDFKLSIKSLINNNRLLEEITLEGCDEFDCYFVHWHRPEIAAAKLLQASHVDEESASISSYRGSTFFTVSCDQQSRPAPLSFAEVGWNQQKNFAYERFADLLNAVIKRDDLLGFSYGAAKRSENSWLPLNARALEAIGETDAIAVWEINSSQSFQTAYSLSTSIDSARQPERINFSADLAAVQKEDKEWLASKKPAPSHCSDKVKALYDRTLLTLRQMQDPGGGIIAAPEFHFPFTHCGGYGYCWGRDAGFISYAMDICGMHEESADFYRYMTRCQSDDGSYLHRHDMDGNLGASWGLLQPDETGSVVYGIWQHVRLSENTALAEELKESITKACEWLVNSKHKFDDDLPISGHDLWEERVGVHYYAVGAMTAGIKAGLAIYEKLGWTAPDSWKQRYEELLALSHSDHFLVKGEGDNPSRFARSLWREIDSETASHISSAGQPVRAEQSASGRPLSYLKKDFVVDISQLGAGYPYDIFDRDEYSKEWTQLIHDVDRKLWREGAGGVGRYESDYYRDGNPWILATVWLGLAAAQHGETDIARKCWDWTVEHATEHGLYSEQIDPKTGNPSWVMPLTWSHAMFALAVHQFDKEVMK